MFSSYGAFWMSYGTIFIPSSGIMAAYNDPTEFANALGIYLVPWVMVTLFFLCVRPILNLPKALTGINPQTRRHTPEHRLHSGPHVRVRHLRVPRRR